MSFFSVSNLRLSIVIKTSLTLHKAFESSSVEVQSSLIESYFIKSLRPSKSNEDTAEKAYFYKNKSHSHSR